MRVTQCVWEYARWATLELMAFVLKFRVNTVWLAFDASPFLVLLDVERDFTGQ